jgi:competence protein ComGC
MSYLFMTKRDMAFMLILIEVLLLVNIPTCIKRKMSIYYTLFILIV